MNDSPEAHSQEARTWGMLCHLTGFAGYVFPFGNIVGPLAVWLLRRERIPFVDDQGKESLNFQITMTLAATVATLLIGIGIGAVMLLVVAAFQIVCIIVATLQANSGYPYRYPLSLRLIK